MPVSDDQYLRLTARMTKLEERVNDIIVAMNKMITLTQVVQLQTLVESQLEDLTIRVDSLETRVETIESEPLT